MYLVMMGHGFREEFIQSEEFKKIKGKIKRLCHNLLLLVCYYKHKKIIKL